MHKFRRLLIYFVSSSLIVANINATLSGSTFLAPVGMADISEIVIARDVDRKEFFTSEHLRDFVKLSKEASGMTLIRLDELRDEYFNTLDRIMTEDIQDFGIIEIFDYALNPSITVGEVLQGAGIPPFIRKKVHDAVIDAPIEKFYAEEGLWHRYGSNIAEETEIRIIKIFFKRFLEFNDAFDILKNLTDMKNRQKQRIRILHIENMKTVFDAHASENYGIHVCDTCPDIGAAIVHEIMALAGISDHKLNEEIDAVYTTWRDQEKRNIDLQKLQGRIDDLKFKIKWFFDERDADNIPEEYIDMLNIFDPDIYTVAAHKKRKPKRVRKYFSEGRCKKAIEKTSGKKEKLIKIIPRLVASMNSTNEQLVDAALSGLNYIINVHPEIELDRIFQEFQLQDIEIVDEFVPILKKEYLKRWSSPELYKDLFRFGDRDLQRDQMEIMLKEVAMFANRALYCKKEYPELAFIAYKKALKLFRKYLKSYAHNMQSYLLVEDQTGWYIARFILNPYDPSKKEIERVINNMFLEIMKNQELFKEQGIKLRYLEELYAEICHINHELTGHVKNRLFLQGSSNTLRNTLLQNAGETMESLKKKEEHARNHYHYLSKKISWKLLLISEEERDFAKIKDPGSLMRRYRYAENLRNQSL